MTILFFKFLIMYYSLINQFYPFNMFDVFSVNIFISTKDGIVEKLSLFKIKVVVIFNLMII